LVGDQQDTNSLCILAATIGEALADTDAENNKTIPSAKELEMRKDDQLIDHCQKLYRQVIQKPGVFAQAGNVLQIRNTLTGAIDPCWSPTNKIQPPSPHPVCKKPTSLFYSNGSINY
jgi:hypothetical protein